MFHRQSAQFISRSNSSSAPGCGFGCAGATVPGVRMNKEPDPKPKLIPLWRAPHPEFLPVILHFKQVDYKSAQMVIGLSQLSAVKMRGEWESLPLHC